MLLPTMFSCISYLPANWLSMFAEPSLTYLSSAAYSSGVFEKFAEHDAEFEMIIVGSGQDRERLENIARNSIYSERIKFRGYVSDADLLELIKGASFSLNLDIADFDLTTLESLALGCPVVVSKICDLRKEFYDINALVCEEEVLQTDVTQLRLMFDQCDRNSIVTLIQKHYLVEDKVKSLVA